MQLIAVGASDNFLMESTCNPHPSNSRDAMMHWFVERNDGFAVAEDMVQVVDMPGILSHVPDHSKPVAGSLIPFSIRDI